MQQVTVNRLELIAKVKENRETHAKTFREARDGFHGVVKAALNKWDNALNHPMQDRQDPTLLGRRPGEPELFCEAVSEIGRLREPQCHLEEYDRALAMLGMSVDETITLQVHEFQQLVMDEWCWKQDFMRTSATYGAR